MRWATAVLRHRQRYRFLGRYRSILWSDRMDALLTHYFDMRGGQITHLPRSIVRASGLGVGYW